MCSFVSLEIQYNYFLAFRLEKLGSNSIGKSPTGRGGELVLFFLPPQIELDWLKPLSIHIHTDGKQERKGGLNRKEEIIPTLGWCSSNVGKKKGEKKKKKKKSLWSGVIHYSVLQMDPSFFYTSTLNLILSIFSLMREGERQTLLKTERITFASSRKQERESFHPTQFR